MLYASLASFLIGAIIGIIQLVQWMNHKRPSRALPISHGVFNVLGFVLLITFAVTSDGVIPTASIILFCIAIVGGLYLYYSDATKQSIPLPVAFIHGLVALVAIALLLVFINNL